jgi:hypothetical protein
MPITGNVTAQYITGDALDWANGSWNSQVPDTSATTGSATTCYDNGGVNGVNPSYSLEISNGSNVNCALSFRFQ